MQHANKGATVEPAAGAAPAPLVPAANEDAGRTAHAKALFEKAANAYASGHYYEAIESFLETVSFRKTCFLPQVKCALARPLPGGLRCNPGGPFAPIRPCHVRHLPPAEAAPTMGDDLPRQLC